MTSPVEEGSTARPASIQKRAPRGMFQAYLRPGQMLSLRPSSFLAPTEGGVRSWVILLFLGPVPRSVSTKTMSTYGASVRKASATTTATRQALAQRELRRVPVPVPPSRRKPAGGYGTISGPPLWNFGGQGENLPTLGSTKKTRTMEISQTCTPIRE